jgi:hypothetical protein
VVPILLLAACGPGTAPLTDAERATVTASVDSATRAFEAAAQFYMYVDGVRSGYDSVVAGIRRTMPSFQHFEPNFGNVEVIVLGRNAAVVSMTFHDSIVAETGDLLRLRGPTTLVWERRATDWLIVYADADHYPDSVGRK